MSRKRKPDPRSETYLIDQIIEKVRKEKADFYNKHPELLVGEIQEIADDYPDILKDESKDYFMAFAAGVLVERYGVAIATAKNAVILWSSKS